MAEPVESERQRRVAQVQRVVENDLQAGLGSIASILEADDDDLESLLTLDDVMEAFKRNQPKLSDEDVERIANRVVKRLPVSFEASSTSPSHADRLRESAHDTVVAVIGGLMTTGVLDLMTYISHHLAGLHFASADEDPSNPAERIQQSYRRESIQQGLLEGLDQQTLRLFKEDDVLCERLRRVTNESLIKAVQETEIIDHIAKNLSNPDYERNVAFAAEVLVSELWHDVATEVGARVTPKDL